MSFSFEAIEKNLFQIIAAKLAGYNDLGRFYKQFSQYLKQTPNQYLIKSKKAKKES